MPSGVSTLSVSERANGTKSPLASRAVEGTTKHPADQQQILEIFKLLVEMADRVSQRRQAANSFYLSVNTGIVGASAYLDTLRPEWANGCAISVAGLLVCVVWYWNIASYKTLNSAKWEVINDLEQSLPAQPFQSEWSRLAPGGGARKHTPFHKVERLVPVIFGVVHITQAVPVFDLLRSVLPSFLRTLGFDC
jgi:hypothetical protein